METLVVVVVTVFVGFIVFGINPLPLRLELLMRRNEGKKIYSSSRLILAKTQEPPDAISIIRASNASCPLIGIGP